MDTIVTPVTVITLDSTRIVHSIKADLVARYFPPVVRLVQYDQSLPVIAVSLMQNGQAYTLPSGAAANIRVHKPDSTYVYNPALGCDSTRKIVYFEVTQAMAAASGDGLAIVEIVVDGDIAGTSLITLHFEENPVPEDAIESSDEWETIYELGERIIASTVTPVSTAAGMTDHNVVYLYTGTESGWNQGHMYYYDGTTWVDAGIAVTDKTLTVEGLAADAKKTGEEIADLKDGLNVTVGNLDNATGVYRAEWEKGGLRAADGVEYDGANLRTKYIDVMPSTPIIINNDSGVKVVLYEFTGAKVLAKRTAYSDTIKSVSLGSTTEYIRLQLESGSNQDVFLAQSVYVSSGKKNLSLDLNNVIKLTNGTDFNTLPSGNYYVGTASSASSMVNCPSQFGGRLIVIDLYMSSDNRLQIYNDSTGGAFYRIGNTSGFQSWKKVITNVEVMNYVFATSFTYGTELQAADDLDAFRTAGNYYVSSRSVAEQILNIPEISGGKLVVMTLASSAAVHQLYISSSNNWYIRELISGTFSEWKKFNSTSDVISEIKAEAIATKSDNQTIANNTNIDSIITAGNYNVGSAAQAQTMTNLPSKLGGRLVVLHLYRTDSVCQLYMDSNSDWYKRQLISGTFTNWEKLTTQSDVDDSIRNSIVSKSAYNVIRAITDNTDYNLAFANAFAPIGLKGYTGNNQNVHPKVLYFQNGFGGHKYWMAYTPYPYSNDTYENPCIAYSDDGYTFRNIAGNPLDDPNGDGYNSDTHLVYRSDTQTLECWYRYIGAATQSPREETIYRQTTTDGVTWTAKELVYSNTSGDYANFLSPSIIVENNKYCMWVVKNSNGIDYWEAPLSDVTSWTKIRTINVTVTDNGITVKPWHIDVIKDGTKYVILMMCRNGLSVTNNVCSLFVITSTDNITYTSPIKVVEGQDGWDKFMYRSSIVKVGDTYRIYYSAGTGGTTSIYSNSTWGIGITESNTLTGGYIGRYF